MQNKTFGDLPPEKIVFIPGSTLGSVPGGITIASADFAQDAIILAGSLAGKDNNGLYHVVKTASLQANATNVATQYNVLKGHFYKVGDVIAAVVGGKASGITAIDTSNALYDVITVGATLGVALTAGDGLFEANVITAGTDSVPKYTPLVVTARSIQIDKGNTNRVGAWYQADIYAQRVPKLPTSLTALIPRVQWLAFN